MSVAFPESLIPAARSAYRSVFRSARVTFHGDIPRRAALENAVRQTFRSPTLTPPKNGSSSSSSASAAATPSSNLVTEGDLAAGTDKEALARRINEWQEVAQFLRRNVVQGAMDQTGSYRLRVTKDTELNDNLVNLAAQQPLTPFPNRDKKRKCGETEPDPPAFWSLEPSAATSSQ